MANRETRPGIGAPALLSLCATELVTLGALVVPIVIGLPVVLYRSGEALGGRTPEQALAIVTGIGAGCALLANLLFGWLSDRTRSASVGRLPWFAGGALAGGVCVSQAPAADSLTGLTLWWVGAQVGYNATFASLQGMLADFAAPFERSRVAGWFAASATGTIVIAMTIVTFLAKDDFVLFRLIPALSIPVVLVAVVVLARRVRSGRVATASAVPAAVEPAVVVEDRDDLAGWRAQFWLLVVQRMFAQFGYAIAVLFSVFYLVRRFNLEAEGAATWASATAACAALAAMVSAVGAGRWSARLGSTQRPMRIGISLVMAGLLALIVAPNPWIYVGAVVAVGIGFGMYTAVDFALVLRAVPAASAARHLGLFNIARTLPQSLTPSLAPLLLAMGSDFTGHDRTQNFTAFYAAGVVLAAIALLLVSKLRVTAPDQATL